MVLLRLSGLCCADLGHIAQYDAAKRIYSTMMAKEHEEHGQQQRTWKRFEISTKWRQKFLINAIPLMVKAGPRDAALAIQLSMIAHDMDIQTLASRLNVSHVTNRRRSLVSYHLIWFYLPVACGPISDVLIVLFSVLD